MSRIIAGRFDKTVDAEGVWRNGWKDFDPRSPLMTP